MIKDVGGFGHLHHEGGLASGEVIDGANAGEDAIGNPNRRLLGWNPAADLSEELDQADLAQITAFPAGIRSGEHDEIRAAAEGHIVGGKGGFHEELLHHWMAGGGES